ncbi:TetR/AcrR family transcriptional regulator [Thermomonospora umbrina]|uniref:TetR family transcriptional regulator n=1 Tax=Thermomonospora umbrina TaxID=111806 RepID=A0A3D9SRP4_9ACTN|nr:TetR/AcrR family transcriptional regulator [Thermomonospora umbrina]REE98277.1 TetR family transcriptional regulator [Thermomonospora umbrina]
MGDTPDIIWLRPERPARGPRPAYSRAQIIEAAVRVADAEGLEAASMRRVAVEIGAGTMSLYRYVPRREDLIELMIDHVHGELDLPDRPTGDWRADLTLLAERLRAMSVRHSWLVRLPNVGLVFGPNMLRIVEFGIGTLDGRGLPIDEVIVLAGIFRGYVDGFVRDEVTWMENERRTGQTYEELMATAAPYVWHLLDSGDHPTFRKIVVEARQPHMDVDARFAYGLERVLDAIAASLPDDTARPLDLPTSGPAAARPCDQG